MSHRIWLTTAVIAVAVTASLAGTAHAASRSTSASASFCSVSKQVGVEIAHLGASLTSATASRRATGLKKELTDIRKAAPSLESHAPKRIKPALNAALSFVNVAYAALSSVHWNIVALLTNPAKAAKLEAAAQGLDGRMAPLKTYYDKVCKFK